MILRGLSYGNYRHAVQKYLSNTLGICFMLKVVCLVENTYVRRRSVDTKLVEIHAEMSEY